LGSSFLYSGFANPIWAGDPQISTVSGTKAVYSEETNN